MPRRSEPHNTMSGSGHVPPRNDRVRVPTKAPRNFEGGGGGVRSMSGEDGRRGGATGASSCRMMRALLLGLVLAAGVLLAGAAGTARAFTVGSPAALYKDTLNGAQIVLSTATVNDWFPSATASVNISFYTLQNVPNGVTLSISSITRASDQQSVTLTLNYTGDFTSDWNLSILVNFSAFYDTSNNQTFGPIPVRVAPLVVGAVSGQATEGGGDGDLPGDAGWAAFGGGDGGGLQPGYERGHGSAGSAHLQHDDLEHGADGDGDGGGRHPD